MIQDRLVTDSLLVRSLPVAVISAAITGTLIVALPTYRSGLYLFTIVLLFMLMFSQPRVQYWRRWCKRDFANTSTRLGAYALAILVLGSGETIPRTLYLAAFCLTWIVAIHFTAHSRTNNTFLSTSMRATRIALTYMPIAALGFKLLKSDFLSQLGALLNPLTSHGVQSQLTIIISLVITGIIFQRTLSRILPACLEWTIVTFVAAGCSLTVFMYPPIEVIVANYPFYTGAAQQSALGNAFNLGVSQYGHGPQAVILAIHAVSGLSFAQSLLVGTMIVNVFFYAILGLSVRAVAGNFCGVIAAGAVVIPALLSQGGIVGVPSVAGMRFLPLAAEVLIICLIFPTSRNPHGFRVFLRVLLSTGVFAISIAWNVDGAAMSLAFGLSFAIFLLGTRYRKSALFLFSSLAFGLVIGIVMSFAADPSNFVPWATEFYVVTQAYLHGLGQLPVFRFTFSDPSAVTSVWVLPIIILFVSMDKILSERRILISKSPVLVGMFALALIALSYFVGRAHPNNLLHVAPFTIAFVIAAAGCATRAHVSYAQYAWPSTRPQKRTLKISHRLVCVLIVVLLTVLLIMQSRELLKRYPDIETLDRTSASLSKSPLLLDIFSSYPQTQFVMALSLPNTLAVSESAKRPNLATYGWPEQDAFGGGPAAQLKRISVDVDCLLVGSELHSAELPATEVTAVTEALDVFPRVLRRWVTTEFWIELRSKTRTTRC